MNSAAPAPLPPGSSGLPLLGETLPFLKDMFGFIAKRMATHGTIFRTKLLGTPTVFIAGPAACERWLDESVVQREGSFPSNVQELFGGRSLPLIDGEEHRARKLQVMGGFSRAALASYIPGLERTVARYLERWAGGGELAGLEELKRLAIEGICGNVMGLAPGAELDRLLEDYRLVMRGLTGLPVQVPGTAYSAGLKARDRILAAYAELIAARTKAPGDDGITRILTTKAADGSTISSDGAKLELHHIVLAGYIIFAEFARLLIELDAHPEVRAKIEGEIAREAPAGPLTLEQLHGMEYLLQVTMEVKRVAPVVPISFGKAKKTFEFNGFTIPEGWWVFMAVGQNNLSKASFEAPETFDPERFSSGRAEHTKHPHAFVPQGPGPETMHKCAGADYSTWFMEVFTVLALRGYAWELPKQDLTLNAAVVPPEQKSGLKMTFRKR